MMSVRIEPVSGGQTLFVDVVCDCGNNGLKDTETGETSFKHEVTLDSGKKVYLECTACGTKFILRPQFDHVHVNEV